MAINEIRNCSIKGIVNVLAPKTELNSEIVDFDAISFQSRTGISTRKVETALKNPIKDYFHKGLEKLLTEVEWDAKEIEVLICITQTPDILFPSIAARLHGEFNFSPHTLCFDINLGCSGYVYGLQVAMSLLNSLPSVSSKAIVCVGDISTRVISKEDTSLRPLFSDGVSVTAIEKQQEVYPTTYFNLETYGNGSDAIKSVYEQNSQVMKMNGIDVFNFSFQFVPTNIRALFETYDLTIPEIDFAVFHQANKMINEAIRKSIFLSENQTLYSIEKYGNTAIASIPITLAEHKEKFSQNSTKVILCGFGVGFSIGTCVLTLEKSIVLSTFAFDEN
jgi:3-oxoacyl-[acyl-carrier-protein] synthase-3